jgi:hypothetical protein
MGQIFRLPFRADAAPQIRLSNRLCVSTPRLTAGGFRRTILTFYLCFLFCLSKTAMCRSEFVGIVPVQIRLSNRLCVSTPRLTAGGSRRTLLTFYLSFLLI